MSSVQLPSPPLREYRQCCQDCSSSLREELEQAQERNRQLSESRKRVVSDPNVLFVGFMSGMKSYRLMWGLCHEQNPLIKEPGCQWKVRPFCFFVAHMKTTWKRCEM